MDTERLYQAPAILSVDKYAEYQVDGCRSIIYAGVPFQDKPVSIFTYYAVPDGKAPVGGWSAAVLVHGGGGTAYAKYVKDWNRAGYAAIALDWYGNFPEVDKKRQDRNKVIPNTVIPNYSYEHAIANIILCHSLLRSFPEVNPEQTILVGASWGGFFALTTAAYDPRYKGVISAYAAGFWQETPYDPRYHVHEIRMPVLRTAVVNELNFPLPRWQQTADMTDQARSVMSIDLTRGHSNVGLVWPINFDFANAVVMGKGELPELGRCRQEGQQVSLEIANFDRLDPKILGEAWLHYTTEYPAERQGKFYNRGQWQQLPAKREGASISARLPAGTKAYFLNLFYNKNPYSSNFVLVE